MPRKPDIILSEKEQRLLDFIKNSEVDVTIKIIEKELGFSFVGALGKLLNIDLVKSGKRNVKIKINELANQYLQKWIKVYFVKKEG